VSEASQEMLDRMFSNGVYNFGFIQVNSLPEMVNMTSFIAIASAFKNYFAIILVAIFISAYLKEEYENGGIRNFVIKGFNKNQILLSKYIAIMVALIMFLFVYFLGYCIMATCVFGRLLLDVTLIFKIITFLSVQIFLIISFASVCFVTAIFTRRITVVIINASMVLLGNMAINIIGILTKAFQ